MTLAAQAWPQSNGVRLLPETVARAGTSHQPWQPGTDKAGGTWPCHHPRRSGLLRRTASEHWAGRGMPGGGSTRLTHRSSRVDRQARGGGLRQPSAVVLETGPEAPAALQQQICIAEPAAHGLVFVLRRPGWHCGGRCCGATMEKAKLTPGDFASGPFALQRDVALLQLVPQCCLEMASTAAPPSRWGRAPSVSPSTLPTPRTLSGRRSQQQRTPKKAGVTLTGFEP